ncbi:MAG: rRNA maturation RNase YbeY [bacterium]|nr:rRNA maturation RNase YbeY [bacterium]
MDIWLEDEQDRPLDAGHWRSVMERMLRHEEQDARTEISVTFVDDASIQELNREHRGKDRPTDVLSFPQWDPEDELPPAPLPIPLGDIVISVETAERQASEYGHSLEREIGFLLAHGLLHLLGLDHETPEEESVMRERQRRLLEAVGLSR